MMELIVSLSLVGGPVTDRNDSSNLPHYHNLWREKFELSAAVFWLLLSHNWAIKFILFIN